MALKISHVFLTAGRVDPSTRVRRAIYLKDLTLLKRVVRSNPHYLRNPDLTDHGNTSLHLAAKLGFLEIAVRTMFKGRLHVFSGANDTLSGISDLGWPRERLHLPQCQC